MANVSVLVITGNGTNCERETAFACQLGGAKRVDIVPIWDVAQGEVTLADYQFLCLPGGFLDGDDLGAARACANRYRHAKIATSGQRLWDALLEFVQAGKLVIGICNGFQLMVKLGLLPHLDNPQNEQQVTLTFNDSGRFEDRWVDLVVDPKSNCVFTQNITHLELPVRHGEGKLLASQAMLNKIQENHLVPVCYADPTTGAATEIYPANPNGSPAGMAGLCDPSGHLFGLMPHPEAFLHRTHHPRWTRMHTLDEEGQGVALFRNAIQYLSR